MQRSHIGKPPEIPAGLRLTYTPNYCEENIYHLSQAFLGTYYQLSRYWDLSVVFISNEDRSIAVWKQDACNPDEPQSPILWDYHCILVMRPTVSATSDTTWVYDYNSLLPMPSPKQEYVQETFKSNYYYAVPRKYQSFFRVVPAMDYIEKFASDRSHMIKSRNPDGLIEYRSPPPNHEPIVGLVAQSQGITNNLMESFVDMNTPPGTGGGIGYVLSADEFWKF